MTLPPPAQRGASIEAPRSSGLPSGPRPLRPSLANGLLLATYGVLALALGLLSSEPPYVTPALAMVALGLGGVATIAIRERFPRIALTGALALPVLSLGFGSGAETILAVMALFIVGVERKALTAWLCFSLALVSGSFGALALGIRGQIGIPALGLAPPTLPRDMMLDSLNTIAIIAVALLIATLLGTNLGHRRRHIRELVEKAELLARERDQQAENARALERERIAREMHDVIAHSLSVMIAISDGAHAVVSERPAEAKEAIGRVAETGRRTLGEVRRLLGNVRNENGDTAASHTPQPDASQLAELATEFSAAGLPVTLAVEGDPSADPTLGLTVYRIVQESLTNVLRHGRQTPFATVTVTWLEKEVTIAVVDDGTFEYSPSDAGRGILGMRERAALYDGTIEAGPHPGGGWRVFARLKCEDQP